MRKSWWLRLQLYTLPGARGKNHKLGSREQTRLSYRYSAPSTPHYAKYFCLYYCMSHSSFLTLNHLLKDGTEAAHRVTMEKEKIKR
eukprot:scaffold13168_cov66-Cyclotella_meneghiniana.AAC.9